MKIAFSLDTVNRSYQEPNLNRTALKFYWDELFKLIGAGGFDAIEMPFSAMPKVRSWDPFSKAQLEARYGGAVPFAKQLRDAGINKVAGLFFTPSVGGPFGSASVATADGFVNGMKNTAEKLLAYAKELGCEYVVISASPEVCSMGGLLDQEEEVLEKLAAAYSELADKAGSIRICIRNEFWGILRGDKMHDFMARVDERIGYCVDLANIKIAGSDPVEFIRRAGSRIGCVSLTDTCFEDKDECWKSPTPMFPATGATQIFKDLGQGGIDLKGVFAALKEVGFDGWATVSNRQSKQVSRGILRARYALNALEEV